MAISVAFDEIELNRFYSEQATGGPMYQTSIIGNSLGVHQRNVNLYDAIRTYSINFEGMNTSDILALEAFFLNREGMGRGFRFFAPNDAHFDYDGLCLNADNLSVVKNATNNYRVYKTYTDGLMTKTRRIVKPVQNELAIRVGLSLCGFYSPNPPGYVYPTHITPPGSAPTYLINMNWATGIFSFVDDATYNLPTEGATLDIISGEFDTPVCFNTDKSNVDRQLTFSNWSGIEVIELLPVNLGITL